MTAIATITYDAENIDMEDALRQLADALPDTGLNMYRWVLENGVEFERAPLPPTIFPKTPKECYNNCVALILRRQDVRRDMVYVEGYGFNGFFPCAHAWLVTKDGKVVDPTWAGPRVVEAAAYWGVPFKTEYLMECITADSFPLIDNWQAGFPVLELPKEQWLHPHWS